MKKNIIINLVICFSIVFMSVGYSALNTSLVISGEASVKLGIAFEITDIILKSAENGAYETYNSTFTENQTNIHITLPNQNSSIVYDIEITNNTHLNYYLDNINELLNNNQNISCGFTNQESLFFAPNSINNIEVKCYYKNAITSEVDLSLNLDYDFIVVPFEKLEYIVSTGSQYVDTGIMNTGDYIFESEFLPVEKAKGEGVWLFSGRKVPNYTLGLYFFISTTYNFTINTYGGSTGSNSGYRLPKDTWYDLYFSRNEFTINSINIPVYSKTIIPEDQGTTILLGGNIVNWDGGVDTRQFEGNIKYFKITDATTNELLRNFVPVKLNDTNEILYWDTVEKVYYSNIGTGVFLEP